MSHRPGSNTGFRDMDDDPIVNGGHGEYFSIERREHATIMAVEPDTAGLRHVRHAIDRALGSTLPSERRAEIVMAVNEAVTNAIEAQQRRDVDDRITVVVDHGRRHIIIDDHGGGIEELLDESPTTSGKIGRRQAGQSPSTSAHRGRGLRIIRSIVPGVQIVNSRLGQTMTLPFD